MAASCVPRDARWPPLRLALRPVRAAASPAQPGDSSLGAVTGAAPGPLGGTLGTAESNGAPSEAVAVARASAGSSVAGGAGDDDSSNNGGHNSFPVAHSARSSFRSVLKRGYLGEMLFVVIGSAICGGLAYWTIGTSLRRFNPYSFVITLPEATGVQAGTPLRMKGVPMGSVLTATPLLDRVKVEVEVNEAKTIIPRTAKFELTQSGMIPAAAIDISTPEGVSAEVLAATVAARGSNGAASGDAAAMATAADVAAGRDASKRQPKVRLAGPKDVTACRLQGVLVCQGDEVNGHVGGSMDELTARMLKNLRQGEAEAEADGAPIVPGRGPVQG